MRLPAAEALPFMSVGLTFSLDILVSYHIMCYNRNTHLFEVFVPP